MQAAVLHRLGDTPRFDTFDDPDPFDHETLVRVRATAISPVDLAAAAGRHHSMPLDLPAICGTDGVGETVDGVRVYFTVARQPFGAMAEYAPAEWAVPVPDGLDDAAAAAIVRPALAAWMPLTVQADLEPGETVLILGATGAAGRMAVQAARLLGAGRIIAAGRGQDALATLGADATIDLRMPPAALHQAFSAYAAEGIDVIVDFLWGDPVELLMAALVRSDLGPPIEDDRGIRLVSVEEQVSGSLTLPSAALRDSRLRLMGSGPANYPSFAHLETFVGDILLHALEGDLSVEVESMRMADVTEAWGRATLLERPVVLMVA
ncbi:NADPH:quinone reductase [Cupriavidus sp. YR651]|uniref:quinone oxidoreductase family protein n=1 Tax=Cupriavidus sp. YR651 TaxID=1855315 RepID=UPI00088C3899|nr:zinc-binding alcohol dehydrogenase family protein [Cupriavidus sp. YR651]SDD80347.1 NADPH:quinone reductase [Cupriavidus sp. YR651]